MKKWFYVQNLSYKYAVLYGAGRFVPFFKPDFFKYFFLLSSLLIFQTPEAGADIRKESFLRIENLNPKDTMFNQYMREVESQRIRVFRATRSNVGGESLEKIAEDLTIYVYTPQKKDNINDLLGLAARCNIPYPAIATLNRLPHPEAFLNAGPMLLPSAPGIFLPDKTSSDLEMLMDSLRPEEEGIVLTFSRNGKTERFRFIPGADFSPIERIFFLNEGFRFPLRTYRVSSSFGPRVNPVTGRFRIHQGIDLAAPMGTDVFAARSGVVSEIGDDPIFGKFVILKHDDNWVSLYGHLSKIEADLRKKVNSGSLIGKVGSTGQSTGPHLHFEIRQNGKAQDPSRVLRLFQ
jgi:murein DD-endopeptidase MepM/ murein hydrolase activator NlpD